MVIMMNPDLSKIDKQQHKMIFLVAYENYTISYAKISYTPDITILLIRIIMSLNVETFALHIHIRTILIFRDKRKSSTQIFRTAV